MPSISSIEGRLYKEALQPDPNPNAHVSSLLLGVLQTSVSELNAMDEDEARETESRTELDSHANMAVIGRNAYILNDSGRTAQVSPFSPDYEALTAVKIVDAAIIYDCPVTNTSHVMVIRNALSVPAMEHNLIPPFIMREAGIQVNEVPKIQVEDPTEDDHSILFPVDNIRIPLSLWGIFSYFVSRMPTRDELLGCNVLMLTPDGKWDPHSDVYARNEENMMDWEGKMVESKDRVRILLTDIDDDPAMISAAQVSAVESQRIDEISDAVGNLMIDPVGLSNWDDGPSVSSVLDPATLASSLSERGEIGRFMASIGSTNAVDCDYLFDIAESLDTNEPVCIGEIDLDPFFVSSAHADRPKGVSAEQLSKVWRIDLETAKRTLEVTTQRCQRSEDPTLSRNYSTNDRMLRYKRINEHFFMDTFFATKKAGKSSRGNNCMQLFVTDKGYVYVVAMKSKGDVPLALKVFAKEIGAPDAIICDAAGEQTSHELKRFCQQMGTTLRVLEEGTPWANRAELYIGLIKEAVRKDMKDSDCPLAFWDYCAERRARINNLTARNLFQLDGRNAEFSVTGEEGDISNLCQFEWYSWCYFREDKSPFPYPKAILGRVLGPAKGEGNEMAQWILKANGKIVPRRTVRPLNAIEISSETEIKKRSIFDQLIGKRWGSSVNPPNEPPPQDDFVEYEDDDEEPRVIPDFDDPVDAAGRVINQQPLYDRLIHAELTLAQGDELKAAKVIGRTVNPDGLESGVYDENPFLNSIVYDVEFPDGEVKEYSANLIAENMLSQVDSEGFQTLLLDNIIDYAKDGAAVEKSEMFGTTKRGGRRMRHTTCGWKLKVLWKDGSEQWIPLKDMKEAHPVECAEFAKARGIHDEPAFAWWVPYTLRKRDVIISAVKARVRRTTHKYGFEVPRNLKHAYEIDAKNGNDFWRKAIEKEMHNVGIAFEILDPDAHVPVGWNKVTGHLVFDIKMDFTRKARWVLDGHLTVDPVCSTYAGVVSRESVRIALTYAALNDIDIVAADIRNAYLQAPSSQKDFIICGSEFGLENVGRKALIRRALYGGKAAGRDFRNHLRDCMKHLNFESCKADPDVWMRKAVKSDGSEYWEYVLLYTDDALVVSENGEHVLRREIGKYFELKEESIGPPQLYLGGRMRKVELTNGVKAWSFSSSQYVQAAVKNVEEHLEGRNLKLVSRAETPISTLYRPEVDISPELNATDAAYYQSLIGILRWMVELGRVDICMEVSMMSSSLAMPREGHLGQVFHIFAYLKKYHNTEMVFDPTDPVIDESQFERKDWTASEFGLGLKEEMPVNLPQPRGLGFVMRAFVDADHASDSVTRRSRTGFLVYLNNAPVYWMSKKQTSVETSSFGSEFIAMKQCCEYLRGLRYKLRMMGIPCESPAYILGDNQSVLYNTTIPESTLKKKSQSIAYHFVREGSARDEWRTAYVNTHENPADLLTKPLPAGAKRSGFVRMILHHIFGTVD